MGVSAANRRLLQRLHRAAVGPVTIDEAAAAMGIGRERAAKLLPYLASQGWLKRVKSGLYLPIPLEATPEGWGEDIWVVAVRFFAPCYLGGWTACSHWGFTDQIFRSVLVYTAKPIRERRGELQGIPYVAHVVPEDRLFGTQRVWRGRQPVEVSDPTRTIVDVLDVPEFGGGVRHVTEVVAAYFDSEHASDELLLSYGERLGNRTVYKRLGFLLERLEINRPALIEECRRRRSRGVSLLDPSALRQGETDRRWDLRVNATVTPVS